VSSSSLRTLTLIPVCFSNAVTRPLVVCSCWPLKRVMDWPWPLPWVAAPAVSPDPPHPASSPQAAAEPTARTTMGRRFIRRRPGWMEPCVVLELFIISLPWDHFSMI
jgi:hypothetical protein